MTSDFEIQPGLTFGEWLHGELNAHYVFETEGWAIEQVNRISERLQSYRLPADRLVVEVPWFEDFNAFTGPGRYIYFSRHMLERLTDEMAAFVIAHEIAHHDLGHTATFPHWVGKLAWMERVTGGFLVGLLFRSIEKQVYGPEQESAADQYGLQLCRWAGYDPLLCLGAFDQMEREALDFRDIDGVFGSDAALQVAAGDTRWTTQASDWLWKRGRGYPSIRARKAALVSFLHG